MHKFGETTACEVPRNFKGREMSGDHENMSIENNEMSEKHEDQFPLFITPPHRMGEGMEQ